MTLIKLQPELPTERVFVVGSFTVDADMDRDFIAHYIYPVRRAKFIRDMALQGLQLHGGAVYLFPKMYAPVAAPASGDVGLGEYEHNPEKRQQKVCKMGAFFLRKAIVMERSVN